MIFDLAYFWRVDPERVFNLSLADLVAWMKAAKRINERQEDLNAQAMAAAQRG